MHLLLKVHPDSPCFAARQIEVEVKHPRPGHLILSYIVTGKVTELCLSSIVVAARSDKLWQHTCFEAFVCASSGTEYYEFNFSPSTQWAAYQFSSYRTGMRVADEISGIPIDVQSNSERYTLEAMLELDRLSALARQSPWRLGLSAVIEDINGRKAYWALAHPPGKPDFHHADCFTHEFFPDLRP